MEKKIINICLCTKDDYFMKYCAALLESLYKNRNIHYTYTIYILWGDISIATKNKINKFSDDNFVLIFLAVDENVFKKYSNIKKKDYIYLYRLFMGDYLKDINKVIYVDCDIIFHGDISEFYSLNLRDNIIGAAKDCINRSLYGIHKLPAFFNSWVLLIDLEKRNQEDIWHKVLQLLNDRQHEFPMWQDQDGLNHILTGKWLPVSPKWNWIQITSFSYLWTQYTKEEFHDMRHPIIVHFAGNHNRPRSWLICMHPKWYLYYFYIFKTAWRDWSDVYKFLLRIITSNFITYFVYKIAWFLFSKKVLNRRYKEKMKKS